MKLTAKKHEAKIIVYQPRSLTAIGSALQEGSARAHNAADQLERPAVRLQ